MRVVVIGGTGNFGARIVRALGTDPAIDLLVAGRRGAGVPGAGRARGVVADIDGRDFGPRLRELSPELVIHCAGPFQAQGYGVATAALECGAHYLDLADGRQFVSQFAEALNQKAVDAGRVAITGASTVPALSSAVVDELRHGLSSLESIEVVIAPGQRASLGPATVEAALGCLGRPFEVWRRSRWVRSWGWMDLREVRLDIGARLAAACDVPDLELFPARYAPVQSVTFHAALEFRVVHLGLWALAALRRMGLPLRVGRWAVGLHRLAGWLDPIAGHESGMWVSVVGKSGDGDRRRRTWQLAAPAADGPEVPCMPAVLLTRRLARGETPPSGARACMGLLALSEFAPEFARCGMTARMSESRA